MTIELLGTELPIVAAPMAGGATTVSLARATGTAGAFPFLAGGYKTPDALHDELLELSRDQERFGVNLFVPSTEEISPEACTSYAARLRDDFARYGLAPDPVRVHDDDHWEEKLALLRSHPVPVVSFTFGLPRSEDVSALQRAGSRVFATVTTPAEARAAAEVGADALVVQGAAAGGHSATFDPERAIPDVPSTSTADIVRAVAAAVDLPLVAAGGVDGPESVRELIAAGARAVAVGTLLLRTPESGASPTHRDALADPRFTETGVTRAFTGRPARGLRNAFMTRHGASAPTGYPEIHHLTRQLRAAAGRAGDADTLHLWAGTGFRAARETAAAEVVRSLASRL